MHWCNFFQNTMIVLTFWSRCVCLSWCGGCWSSGRGLDGGCWCGCNWWGTCYGVGGAEAFSSPARIRLETNHHATATRQHRSRDLVSTETTYNNWDSCFLADKNECTDVRRGTKASFLDSVNVSSHPVERHHLKHHHRRPQSHHMILGQGQKLWMLAGPFPNQVRVSSTGQHIHMKKLLNLTLILTLE